MTDLFNSLGITDAFTWLAEQLNGAETWQQILFLVLGGGIPFIESYLGSFLGILLGVPAGIAIPAAIVGNMIVTLGLVLMTSSARSAVVRARAGSGSSSRPGFETSARPSESRRKQRVRRQLERFGVPGVSLLGPILLASQITAPLMVAAGAARRSVLVWQGIAIIVWGVAFGVFGEAMIEFFGWGV